MKKIIIYAHPYNESFCKSIVQTIEDAYKQQKQEYFVVDLYKENFDPCLDSEDLLSFKNSTPPQDIKKHQNLINESDELTIVFPLWWGFFPAILKGYFDKILSYDFAYTTLADGTNKGLLNNRKANVIITMGNDINLYHKNNIDSSIKTLIDICILQFCNLKLNNYIVLDRVHKVSFEQRKKWLSEIHSIYLGNK